VARRPAPPGALTAQRWLEVAIPGRDLALVAVHVPPVISVGEEAKQAFWDLLLAWAAAHQAEPVLLVGDLNTGAPGLDERGATLYCAPSFIALGASGWVDAWRHFHGDHREWTWQTPRRRYGPGSTTRSRRRARAAAPGLPLRPRAARGTRLRPLRARRRARRGGRGG
jgi:exonuclease III